VRIPYWRPARTKASLATGKSLFASFSSEKEESLLALQRNVATAAGD
jgi:hypothetical protein